MGARLPAETDPPGDGEPPVGPPRRKQPSKPQVEVEPLEETMEHSKRSMSPGGFKLEGPGGWRMTIPHALIIAVLAGGGGTAVGAKVVSDMRTDSASSEARDELKLLRKEMGELAGDVRIVRDGQVNARSTNKKLANYTEQSIAPIVAALRKCCSTKLEYSDDAEDVAKDIDFHPAPVAGSKAPQYQPKALIPAKPTL